VSAAAPPVKQIDHFLGVVYKRGGSDLHLAVGSPPILRIDGELERIRYREIGEGDFFNLLSAIIPPELWNRFQKEGDVDFAYQMGQEARFRVNLLKQENGSAAVFRLIPPTVPSCEELNLPKAIGNLAFASGGLVLVCGPTGSGKSTTLAAILDRINKKLRRHIITIEDPVEFVHVNDKALFTQRQIGPDLTTFAEGVRAALREDPDALLIGEMRDLETMLMALRAAETGLLVFATLHTNSAAKAVDRIINSFSHEEQDQVRVVLAESLKAVVAQQLLKKIGGGRVAAFEILLGSSALSNAIREGKISMINTQIQTGKARGMVSLDQSLQDLVKSGTVKPEDAFDRSIDKDSFKAFLSAAARQPQMPAAGSKA
jgi:twitching motility protein PilT